MKPTEFRPVQLIFPGDASCYQIPPFQRNYQWGLQQIHGLVHDIKTATFEKPHWIGVALLSGAAEECSLKATEAGHVCYDVLDGQQRLLTTRIWCIALIDEYVRQTGSAPTLYSRERLTSIKVHALDFESWQSLTSKRMLEESKLSSFESNSILHAYFYFRLVILNGLSALMAEEPLDMPENEQDEVTWLNYLIELSEAPNEGYHPISPDDIIELINSSLEKIKMTTLLHEEGDEEIEVIFETLNSARVELGQWDLFRNYILIKSQQRGLEQKSLYTRALAKSESDIQKAKLDLGMTRNLDRFLYDFLIAEAIDSNLGPVRSDSTARRFKRFWETDGHEIDVERYLTDTLTPSMQTWLTAFQGLPRAGFKKTTVNLPDPAVRSLVRIEGLSKGPFVPLTSRILRDWLATNVPRDPDALVRQLRLVESFAVRMLLASEPFSPMRRLVSGACLEIFGKRTKTLEQWIQENSPTDDRIRSVMTQSVAVEVDHELQDPDRNMWPAKKDFGSRAKNRQVRAIFDGLIERREGVLAAKVAATPCKRNSPNEQISIEHFYPQSPNLWVSDLTDWGTDLDQMDSRLHAIGNIAILPAKINSSISNRPLAAKQEAIHNLQVPDWKVNHSFMVADLWGPKEIDTRTIELTELCLEVWKLGT